MRRSHSNKGFTLIELLVVTSIIGLLASIAIPQYASFRSRGYDGKLQAAVRHVATGEEGYFASRFTYTTNVGDMSEMVVEPDVAITITAGNSGNIASSFRVKGSHPVASHTYEWVSDPLPGDPNFIAN